MGNNERVYLEKLIGDVSYDENVFEMQWDEKPILGVMGTNDIFSQISNYRVLYNTVMHTDYWTKTSLFSAIEQIYGESPSFLPGEPICIYHIENAVFRVVVLWDILAQFYNLYYNVGIDPQKIAYKKFFKTQLAKLAPSISSNIHDYLSQIDDTTTCMNSWKGNHEFLSDYRNQMTHRNSPNITAFSDFSFHICAHPRYVLKRVAEDYSVVSGFITDFINSIDIENTISPD